MNKKFLSAILFGALMVTSTGTFVSCKDYDDDIDAINKELTDVKSQIAALQAKVDAGKWITSASQTAAGVTITLSDGSSLNITNGKDGKDGAQGAAGQDGKNGTVVTVNENGVLCLDGVETAIKVAEEAPAAKPCVKVENDELYVLNAEGEYVASGIKACGVTAVNTNGVWTITVDGESITVPGSAALTSIAIQKAPAAFKYYYGVVKADKTWGWNKEETIPAGFYSKLGQDINVLLNPAEADGTAFTYTFKNSLGVAADVEFFGEARPAENVALTRAASENGLWTLPAAVTAKPAAESEALRRELYLNFKQNDGNAYLLSLEAVDGLGNVAVRSDYEYTIELAAAPNDGGVYAPNNGYCLIGETYYPVVTGAVYDYKIRVNKAYERLANVYGVTTDGKSFSASSESAIYNSVKFDYALVRLNGTSTTGTFTVYFTNEMISTSNAVQAEALNAPLDATLVKDADKVYRSLFKYNTTYKSELSIDELDATAQMLWAQAINEGTYSAELIGGETQTGDNNYNEVAVNTYLKNNAIDWYITYNSKEDKYYLVADFYVDPRFEHNFQLETAYQLNIVVKDHENNNVTVATAEFPFEFEQPTLDITQENGKYAQWGTTPILRETAAGVPYNSYERALLVYGVKGEGNNNMYLPMYESFTAWKAADKANGIGKFQEYVANAKYYNLHFKGYEPARILSETTQDAGKVYNYALDNKLDYTAVFQSLNTWALYDNVKAAAQNSTIKTWAEEGVAVAKSYELSTPIEVLYKHYGVYPAYNTLDVDADGNVVDYNGKIEGNTDDFHLVFASWLNHSTLEMAADSYTTERGTHHVYFTNDDLNFKTPMGDTFYMFDGLVNGKVQPRAKLNGATFDEIDEHPFTEPTALFAYSGAFKAVSEHDMTEEFTVEAIGTKDYWMHNADGEAEINLAKITPDDTKILVAYFGGFDKAVSGDKVSEAIEPGMYVILPNSMKTGESVILTTTITDTWGYKKSFDITIVKK